VLRLCHGDDGCSVNPSKLIEMKLKYLSMIAVPFFAGSLAVSAQEKKAPEVVQVVYEVFSLSEAEAAQSQRDSLTDREAYAQMTSGVKSGKVKQEKLMALRVLGGQKATTSHVSELIFATQYDPPKLPNQVGVSEGGGSEDGPSLAEIERGPGWQSGSFPATPATPSIFDRVNLGDTLEVEAAVIAVAGKPEKLMLRMAANHTKLKGFDVWGQGLAEGHVPWLSKQKVQSNIQVESGAPILVGTVSRSNVEQDETQVERVWFAFVTATLVKVEK